MQVKQFVPRAVFRMYSSLQRLVGKQYVDGGLVSPIPVKTAKDMGADIVIAVDISARPVGGRPLNMWGLLDQTINIMGQQSINEELSQATVVIQPKVGHLGTLDLKASNQSILEGEKATQLKIIAIEKAITDFKSRPLHLKQRPKPKSKKDAFLIFKDLLIC